MKYWLLVLHLCLAVLLPTPVVATETINESNSKTTDIDAESPLAQCLSENSEVGALDNAYHYLNTKFCQPAIWFDSFFVDERITEDSRAGTMVRWYFDYIWSESEGYHFETRLNAKLHLPRATKKLKLVFESDSDEDLFDLFPNSREEAENSLGLRYDWYAKERSSFNVKVSLRPSIEGRYRYSYPISADFLLTFTQRIYSKESVLGERSQVDLDHSLNDSVLIRWTNYAKYEDDINSFELGTGVTLYQSLSDKSALSYQASVKGYDRPDAYISNTHLSVTYRQNVYREWLYYELIPEYNWDKEAGEERLDEASITFRLEFLFNNI